MPTTTTATLLHLLLLLLFLLSFLSSTSTLHHRRILHQPLIPLDSSPPSQPPTPSPPTLPFTPSTPSTPNSPFFPSYPSPPAPPSPASFASFPANISSLSVPRPSKSNSTSSKLIIVAIAAVIAAIAVVSLAVFLHLRNRSTTHQTSCSKTQRSDNGSTSTVSFNQTAPINHHIPKLQRPSQTSSEFLYLGTLVNSHAPGGGTPFNGGGASSNNYNNASNARKLESPELRPLPPLNMQQRQNLRSSAEVVPSKDDESEEFYSPKGSINGSNGTGSASRRAFAAIEVENFNGSTSNSSSSSSSSAPGSGSGSPARSTSSVSPANNLSPSHSVPKSPDLIEIQTIASLPLQTVSLPEMRSSLLHESASPSPPSSSSPERDFRRSVESSPRNSDVSDQNVESPARSIPTTPEIGVLVLPESASPLPPSSPSQERYSRRSEESSPRNANVSDKHNTTVTPTPPEMLPEFVSPLPMSSSSPEICLTIIEESSPRNSNVSDQNVESPVRSNSPSKHSNSVIPTSPEILLESTLPLPTSSLLPENYLRSEESSPRNSNVSDHYVESPVRISSPSQHNSTVIPTPPEMLLGSASALPMSSFSPERFLRRSEGSSPRNSDVSDDNVESPVRISSPSQHNSTVIPTSPEILLESASALPASSSSPERYLRKSEESSPRNSNVSDQNVESPVRISSPSQHNSTVISTAPEMESLVIHGSASLSPLGSLSPERKSGKNEEPSSRISNASNHDVETPVSSPVQHNIITPLEMQDLVLSSPERYSRRSEESSLRISNVSDQDVASLVRISSPEQLKPPSPMSTSLPERYLIGSDEALARMLNDFDQTMESLVRNGSDPDQFMDSPLRNGNDSDQNMGSPVRNGNDSDQNMEPPVRNGNDIDQNGESPVRNGNDSDQNVESPVRNGNDSDQNVESPVRNGNDTDQNMESPVTNGNDSVQNMESPVRSVSSVQHSTAVIPTPPPPPPAHLPAFVPSIPFPAPPVSVILPPRVSIPSPPPPPPLPLSKVWQSPKTPTPLAKKLVEPPTLINPLRPIAVGSPSLVSPIQLPSNDSHTLKNDGDKESPNKETEYSSESVDSNGDSPPKPKLKPLHWDKVRASSDREMVWDQLKCSSFKVNEEMIETLFVANTSKPNPKETNRWQVLPSPGQDNGNRVLDPKKAQNIAILLKALHVTVDEVCEGLLEGNADILGTELLESLLKMAPTKEEECKLKEHNDDSSVKLGPAERFLKAVVDIPHAFRRVEAMLYISNFESEVEYLKKSFSTLESACEELRTSRMFLKLLEAVLKTGNRMNVGTNRGDAQAFKLDTLLKLVDVKGADGKTTLLHFVVQEIIRSEGARLSGESSQQDASINDDAKCRKLGLQVVSALSSELSNVKKAAVMDAEMLSSEVSKLSKGIGNVREIVTLNEATSLEESVSHKFSDSMNSFIEKAEEEIFRIQAQENLALSLVKEITEYFHGNSAKEEAHPFRIFMVVRDFLTILDRVCKEVGMINERTIVTSAHKFPVPVNPMLQLPVPVNPFHKRQYTSSDDESLPLNI